MTDPLQVSVDDIVEMEIGKSFCNPDHLGVPNSVSSPEWKSKDSYNSHAVDTRVPVKVLQNIPIRHPRGHHAQLGDVGSRTKSRDQIGVIQPLPHCNLLIIPLV